MHLVGLLIYRLWVLFLHHTHHGLNIFLCVIHRQFRWGLGSKTGQSMWNLWWTKRLLDRVFSQCSVFPCHHSTSASCLLVHHHRLFVILANGCHWLKHAKESFKNNEYVWHRRSFKDQCYIGSCYTEATSVLLAFSTETITGDRNTATCCMWFS